MCESPCDHNGVCPVCGLPGKDQQVMSQQQWSEQWLKELKKMRAKIESKLAREQDVAKLKQLEEDYDSNTAQIKATLREVRVLRPTYEPLKKKMKINKKSISEITHVDV